MFYQILLLLTVCVISIYSQGQITYQDIIHNAAAKLPGVEEFSETIDQDTLLQIKSISPLDYFKFSQRILHSIKTNLKNEKFQAASPVSQQCTNDTALFLGSLSLREKWAVKMLDAFGKPKPGLMTYSFNWVGLYEECLDVKPPRFDAATGQTVFDHARYCSAYLPISLTPAPVGISLGTCIPNSCNASELVFLLNSAIDNLNTTLPFRFSKVGSLCQMEELPYSTKAIVAIVVGTLFALIMCVGTMYDIVFIQLATSNTDQQEVVNDKLDDNSIRNLLSSEQTPLLDEVKKASVITVTSEQSVCARILLSFSVYSNGIKILSTNQPKGSLTSVHGIRFLSMTWVILGHTIAFAYTYLDNGATFLPRVLHGFAYQGIVNATVSVDSFFTLSGLLVAYLTLKELKKNDGKLNWFMFYFHRYWRLTPPYMLLMLIYVPLFPYIAEGPFWSQQGIEKNECKDTWWTNLLYINNLVKRDSQCMGWSWYLANDMQFYILSPLIIVPLYYKRVLGFVVSGIFLLGTFITTGVISTHYHLNPALGDTNLNETSMANPNFMLEYYYVPYTRMGPYVIGLLAGYYLYVTELRIKWNKVVVIVGWCVSIASALAVVYGLYGINNDDYSISQEVASFYLTVHRTVWGVCVSWVVIACVGGYGGPVNVLLSWKALIPLSRLTYCAYLIHPIVIFAFYAGQKKIFYMTDSLLVFLFFGMLVASYMLAFLLSLMFESPMMGIESVIFKRKKK